MKTKKSKAYTVKAKKHKKKPEYSAFMYTVAVGTHKGTLYQTYTYVCEGKYPTAADIQQIAENTGPIICIQRLSLEGMDDQLEYAKKLRKMSKAFKHYAEEDDYDDEDFDISSLFRN